MTKWILIAIGFAIFAGVGIPVAGTQADTEFRLAEHARDACYANAGYDRFGTTPASPELMRQCTQSIRDWEGREWIRLLIGAVAGLIAALVYTVLVVLGRRALFSGEPDIERDAVARSNG